LSYPTIEAIPEKIDLALVMEPPEGIPERLRQCAGARIPAVILLPVFSEGPAILPPGWKSAALHQVRRSGMRFIGPGSFGMMVPPRGMNATLFLENDPNTTSIFLHIESIDDVPSFVSVVRQVSLLKPLVVLRAQLPPSVERPLEVLLHHHGLFEVKRAEDFFYMACWMGGSRMARGDQVLVQAGIPVFPYPETAVHAFITMGKLRPAKTELPDAPLNESMRGQRIPQASAASPENSPFLDRAKHGAI